MTIIIDHLKNNLSVTDYLPFIKECIENYYPLAINEDKVPASLKKLVKKNFKIADDTTALRMSHCVPKIGDFIRIKDEYYRIAVGVGRNRFQYTKNGSFYLCYESASYSGGFSFDHCGGVLNYNMLNSTEETKEGGFWFFSNNNAAGYNGVHFTGQFRVFSVTIN